MARQDQHRVPAKGIGIDTTTPAGRMMMQMVGAFADHVDSAVMRSPASDAERTVAQDIARVFAGFNSA